jgi:hypothetical protein
VNLDDFPLGLFEVDCDGSACGSGDAVGLHVHAPQHGGSAVCRVVVRDGRRVSYRPAEGITRMVMTGGAR